MTIRVFLVDDHEVVRRGVCDLISAEEGLVVVGEAATAEAAMELVPVSGADVVVLDVRLPDGDGVELCRELRSQNEHLVPLMLTSFDDDEALLNAVMAGAAGYVLKQIRGTELIDAIRRVAAGEQLISPSISRSAFERLRAGSTPSYQDAKVPRLTVQEQRILDLIAEGCTNRQIAARMFLAEKTVKNYVSNLLRKMGMQGRTEAAVYATRISNRGAHSQQGRQHPPPGERHRTRPRGMPGDPQSAPLHAAKDERDLYGGPSTS